AYHWEPDHWFDHIAGKHYRIDEEGVSEETGNKQPIVIGTVESDVESLNDNRPEEMPFMPRWRVADTEEARAFQTAMTTALPMPHPSAHPHSRPAAQTFLGRLLRLLGIGHR
ncbi:MAG: hypothetical protein NT075_35390, partial [Chloroflexi bacterium]|nr:hypothetical protein [Chloroflexota bacterium]